MEITGRIKVINQEQQINPTFKKREMVVTTEEQYPQHILIEFIQDKVNLLDQFNLNDLVKVSINIRGREWTNPQGETRYFNSIHGWRIERVQTEQPMPPQNQGNQVAPVQPNEAFEPASNLNEDEHDDLPF